MGSAAPSAPGGAPVPGRYPDQHPPAGADSGADSADGRTPADDGTHLRHDSRLMDLVTAGGFLVLLGLVSVVAGMTGDNAAVALLASILMPVALYWRRTHPVASAVVVYATALLHFAAGVELLPVDLVIFVSLYSVTAHGPRWAGRVALAGGLLGSALQGLALTGLGAAPLWDNLPAALYAGGLIGVVCLLAWALGLLRRSRLAHTETLAERARRLEIERDQQAQIATAAERSRIAREMHDVVAHSLSVVIAQADGGRYAAGGDPDAAVRALTTIGETGRAALADMRKILGVLRGPDGEQPQSATTPQPIDADLEELVEQVRGSGTDVSLVRVGHPRPLPPGLGLTVYRICQEALTNVLKHGGPSAGATVLLQWSPQRITLQVDDTGRGAAATDDGAGHGILGMRERVGLFAGTLDAGPRTGGGFRVRAEIPLPSPGQAPGWPPQQSWSGEPPANASPGDTSPVGTASPAGPPLAPASWPQIPQNGAT